MPLHSHLLPPRSLRVLRLLGLGVLLVALQASGAAVAADGLSPGACPGWLTALKAGKHRPEVHASEKSTLVGPSSAIVGGFVATGSPVSFLVQYGENTRYGSCSGWLRDVPREVVAKVMMRDLDPATRYHFRLVAKTSAGVVFGADQTLRTLADGVIPQGVTIGEMSVGGLSSEVALGRLGVALKGPLRFGYAGAYWRVDRSEVGAALDAGAAIEAALAAKPGDSVPAATVQVDPKAVARYVATLGARWNREGHPSSVKLHGKHAVVLAASPAAVVDEEAMAKTIETAVVTGDRSLLALAMKPGPLPKGPPLKAVVVRLASQTLTAYLDGKPILTTPITTGRPALPTPMGNFHIHFRASPYTFISPWAQGSAYYYPPAHVNWAMYFYDNDFLHDSPSQPSSSFGAGSQYGPYASHGCVHVPRDKMSFLFHWLPVGAPVVVSQT